eukprot:4414123-Prymnesium_polylepis.1
MAVRVLMHVSPKTAMASAGAVTSSKAAVNHASFKLHTIRGSWTCGRRTHRLHGFTVVTLNSPSTHRLHGFTHTLGGSTSGHMALTLIEPVEYRLSLRGSG